MGIVNVTPDSFSDGGLWLDAAAAIEHGAQLHKQGAAIEDHRGIPPEMWLWLLIRPCGL